jgi:hypothetical protein
VDDFPFGGVVDPRDVAYEAQADQVRVEVWEGVAPGHGGTCTAYAGPIEHLAAILAWQQDNPTLHINVGVTVRFNAQVVLVKVAQHSATAADNLSKSAE